MTNQVRPHRVQHFIGKREGGVTSQPASHRGAATAAAAAGELRKVVVVLVGGRPGNQ